MKTTKVMKLSKIPSKFLFIKLLLVFLPIISIESTLELVHAYTISN